MLRLITLRFLPRPSGMVLAGVAPKPLGLLTRNAASHSDGDCSLTEVRQIASRRENLAQDRG
jgi:hypothetical protein